MNNTTENFNLTSSLVPSVQISEIIFAYNLYLIISMVLGLLGNLLVLAVYIKHGAKYNTDWFIVFITVYDFISSFLNVPVYMTFTIDVWRHYGNDIICKIHMVFSQSTVLSSAFLIGGLALERYVKICRPTTRVTRTFSRNTCIILSVVTFVSSLPVVLFYDNRSGLCRQVTETETLMFELHRIYYVTFVLVFVILFIVIIFSYFNIALAILRSRANIERHNKSKDEPKNDIKCKKCVKMICCGNWNKINKNTATNVYFVDDSTTSTQQTTTFTQAVYIPSESSTSGNDDLKNGSVDHPAATTGSASALVNVRQVDKTTKARRSLRTTRLTFLVCLVFVLSWLPPWAWFAASNFVTPKTTNYQTYMALRLFCPMSFLINTFANPLLYISLNESFREKVKNLIRFK